MLLNRIWLSSFDFVNIKPILIQILAVMIQLVFLNLWSPGLLQSPIVFLAILPCRDSCWLIGTDFGTDTNWRQQVSLNRPSQWGIHFTLYTLWFQRCMRTERTNSAKKIWVMCFSLKSVFGKWPPGLGHQTDCQDLTFSSMSPIHRHLPAIHRHLGWKKSLTEPFNIGHSCCSFNKVLHLAFWRFSARN